MAKKIPTAKKLLTYIQTKQRARIYWGLALGYKANGATEIVAEIDAIDRLLVYVDKLLEKTPNFKKYMKKVRRGYTVSDIANKDIGISKRDLDEEVYYLSQHIMTYEEKDNE